MLLQSKNLMMTIAVVTGLLTAAAAQAQTSSQNPSTTKPKAATTAPKAQTAAPATTPAPAPQEEQGPPPPASGMGRGMGQGWGAGVGSGMGRGFDRGFGGMMDGPGMQGQMMMRRMGRAGMMGMGLGARLMRQLNLTQAQKDQLKAIQEQQRKDMQAVRDRLKGAREKLRDAMKVDIPDEAAVRAAAGALASIQADQFALQARVKGQRMKVFTPEQQKQLKDARERMTRFNQRMMRNQRQMLRQQMMRRWRDGI